MALWLLWHSVSSILGSGLGPLGTWFGLGTSSSSGCWSPIWGSPRSLPTAALPEWLIGSDFTSSGIPWAKCRDEWWCGPEKHLFLFFNCINTIMTKSNFMTWIYSGFLKGSFYSAKKSMNYRSTTTNSVCVVEHFFSAFKQDTLPSDVNRMSEFKATKCRTMYTTYWRKIIYTCRQNIFLHWNREHLGIPKNADVTEQDNLVVRSDGSCKHTHLAHETAWGQGAVAAGVSEMQGASCLVAAAACSQLPAHELCNKWSDQINNTKVHSNSVFITDKNGKVPSVTMKSMDNY